jgi:hypothetical protein
MPRARSVSSPARSTTPDMPTNPIYPRRRPGHLAWPRLRTACRDTDTAKVTPVAVKAANAEQRKTLKNAPRAAAPAGRDDGGADTWVDVQAVTEAARAWRRRCAISADEGHHPKLMLALEMLDGLAERGLQPLPLAADAAGYGDNSQAPRCPGRATYPPFVQVNGDAVADLREAFAVERVWSGHGRAPTCTEPCSPLPRAQSGRARRRRRPPPDAALPSGSRMCKSGSVSASRPDAYCSTTARICLCGCWWYMVWPRRW